MTTTKFTLELPALYGDHHVVEVRRILLALPGVASVYASSCFHVVEVEFEPSQVSEAQITGALDAAGYLGELDIPVETGMPANTANKGEPAFFRHAAVFEQVKSSVSFGQYVSNSGRPLWQCPGLGVIKKMEE